jgi:hypothetical protein
MQAKTMSKPEMKSPEEQSLLQRGLEPDTVENLKSSQQAYKKIGVEMSLDEVYQFEMVDSNQPSETQDSTEDGQTQEAQLYTERVNQVAPQLKRKIEDYWS